MKVNGMDYLLVERYDRIHKEGTDAALVVERLHQEDFCQAQGIVSNANIKRRAAHRLANVLGCCARFQAHPSST